MKRAIVFWAVALCGCASEYTVVERSGVVVSANSRVVAKSVLPHADAHPSAAEHLALAEEVYQKQLALLKERRNKVRGRRRGLNFASYAVLASTGLGAGAGAIGAQASDNPPQALRGVGSTALVGVGVGTLLQILGLMQEDQAVLDGKIHQLERMYGDLLEQVQPLAAAVPPDDARIGEVIERFINEALSISVKG